MKKGFKKELEHELAEVIKNILSGHNTHALAKTKKAVKQASKIVSKKFVKTLKALAEKRSAAARKKSRQNRKTKVKPDKNVASKKVKPKDVLTVRQANGRFKSVKKKIILPGALKRKVMTPAHASEHN
jgi:hypothetical protein